MLAPGAVQPRYLPRELWFHGVRATLLTYGRHAFHPDVKLGCYIILVIFCTFYSCILFSSAKSMQVHGQLTLRVSICLHMSRR